MRGAPALLVAGLVAAGLGGCAADEPERSAAKPEPPSPVTTATPAAVLGRPMTVPGTANIFGASRDQRPPRAVAGPGSSRRAGYSPAWPAGSSRPEDHRQGQPDRRLGGQRRRRRRSLAPRIGQTVLVGNGKGRSYAVPPGATRLYLGFADGYLYVGHPGWYGNNAGRLSVTVKLAGAR